MAIIERRVFFGKIGAGGELVAHIHEGNSAMERHGVKVKSRVLSDHNSGRTDRVVAEWEMDQVGQMDANIEGLMADPKAQAEFGAWIAKLNDLVHYAEVEHWHVH